jgi:hypothetical protein
MRRIGYERRPHECCLSVVVIGRCGPGLAYDFAEPCWCWTICASQAGAGKVLGI